MRLFTFILGLIIIQLISCQSDKENTHDKSQQKADKDLKVFITDYVETFNQHNWNNLADLYKDHSMVKDPSTGMQSKMITRDSITAKYSMLQHDIPDVRLKLVSVYTSDEHHIIAEFISEGTMMDGSKLWLPMCTIFKIVDGQIESDYTYYDMAEL